MMLNAAQDYALRMCGYLARKGGAASSKEIAEATGAPRDYLIQLAQLLRNTGVVKAQPGKHGGYSLAKQACEISVGKIVFAVDDRTRDFAGTEYTVVDMRLTGVLAGMTLEEVV